MDLAPAFQSFLRPTGVLLSTLRRWRAFRRSTSLSRTTKHSFPALLDALSAGSTAGPLLGVTHRIFGRVVREDDAPLIADLDTIPTPAFDLYFDPRRPVPDLPVEVGRGCPYGCTFCSTNDFFRRRFRLRSPQAFVAELDALRRRWNARRFEFVHDMFTVDRKRVLELCASLERMTPSVEWYCSGRTDRVDPELLDRMWSAGCRGIFYGVESGSAAVQITIGKRLSLEGARSAVRHTAGRRR